MELEVTLSLSKCWKHLQRQHARTGSPSERGFPVAEQLTPEEQLMDHVAAMRKRAAAEDWPSNYYALDKLALAPKLGIELLRADCVAGTMRTNDILNLRLLAPEPMTGQDAFEQARYLGPCRHTGFALRNSETIWHACQLRLDAFQEAVGRDFLRYIADKFVDEKRRYGRWSIDRNPPETYCFWGIEEFKLFVSAVAREAEGEVRAAMGVKPHGEGWDSETELFYLTKHLLPGREVIFHARPRWLKRLELDIYVPEIGLAIEYMGRQHYEPVEFFGGQEAHDATKARDARKAKLCDDEGVSLRYITYKEDLKPALMEVLEPYGPCDAPNVDREALSESESCVRGAIEAAWYWYCGSSRADFPFPQRRS